MAKKKKGDLAGPKKSGPKRNPAPEIEEPAEKHAALTAENNKTDELPFTFYLPAQAMKQLRILSATDGISIKKLINTALAEKYNIPVQ